MEEGEQTNQAIEDNSYLIRSTLTESAYSIFSDVINAGHKGLCITRTHPADVKKLHNTEHSFVWLSNQKSDEFQTTIDLSELKVNIANFIKKNKKSVILLDRLDYLISMHGFNNILKFIYSLNDEVLMKKATLLVNVNPNTLSNQELSLLSEELQELLDQQWVEGLNEFADDLHEILVFVNNNDRITFKKVSKEFLITKTTTRKRINKLLEKNLITVKKNGRNKIISITDSGKSLL